MKNKKQYHCKAPPEDSEENLRGLVRKQQKRIKLQNKYIGFLEKQLRIQSSGLSFISTKKREKIKRVEKKPQECENCGSDDLRIVPIWTPPDGEKEFIVCQNCYHNTKMK